MNEVTEWEWIDGNVHYNLSAYFRRNRNNLFAVSCAIYDCGTIRWRKLKDTLVLALKPISDSFVSCSLSIYLWWWRHLCKPHFSWHFIFTWRWIGEILFLLIYFLVKNFYSKVYFSLNFQIGSLFFLNC